MCAGIFISGICFPPEGTHEHIAVGLTSGDIKVFSHDLNEGPLFSLQEPNSVIIPCMHELKLSNLIMHTSTLVLLRRIWA